MRDTQKVQTLQLVKRMIAKEAENKATGVVVENAVLHNSSITSADCVPVIPEIKQGDSAEQRIGDRVKSKTLTVRGTLALNGGLTGGFINVPIQVRVMILSQKDIKLGSSVVALGVAANNLLKPSIDALPETNFSGTTINATMPVNRDLFRVYYDRTFTLCGPAASGIEAINRFVANWSYRFKSLPASLTYSGNSGDWANNFAPFLAIGYSYPDGASPDVTSLRLVSTTFAKLDFEDA